jgi:hypothetical protein
MSLHIAPSIQYRKADQPEGIAMGSMYSRGLILFHVLFLKGVEVAYPDTLLFQVD